MSLKTEIVPLFRDSKKHWNGPFKLGRTKNPLRGLAVPQSRSKLTRHVEGPRDHSATWALRSQISKRVGCQSFRKVNPLPVTFLQ